MLQQVYVGTPGLCEVWVGTGQLGTHVGRVTVQC